MSRITDEYPAWNPRYVCYAKAHGLSPEAMRTHDNYHNGAFMIWNQARRAEFAQKFTENYSSLAYDAWLEEQVNESE